MKHLLLSLFLVPLLIHAQIPVIPLSSNENLVKPALARANHIHSTQQLTILSTNDHWKRHYDTAVTVTELYDTAGQVVRRIIHVTLDKTDYTTRMDFQYNLRGKLVHTFNYKNTGTTPVYHSDFFYDSNGHLSLIKRYDGDRLTDSTVVTGEAPHRVEFTYREAYCYYYEKKEDSLHLYEREVKLKGMDTVSSRTEIIRAQKTINDSFCTIRTVYRDGNEHITLTVVDHLKNNQIVQTEYFNRRMTDLRTYSSPYNGNLSMTWYMKADSKGGKTYEVLTTYNEKGLVKSKQDVPARSRGMVTILNYEYTYYH